jgi:hypothetical protein
LTHLHHDCRIIVPMQVYLSGAIEYSPDRGMAWRKEITPFLRGLGHHVYDPALDERKNLSEDEWQNFRRWKREDVARFRSAICKIIEWDLDWVERKADYIICYWDMFAGKGAGTQGELTMAFRSKRPVYLVTTLPVEEISGWVLGCSTQVFHSFDELRAFLQLKYGVPSHDAL